MPPRSSPPAIIAHRGASPRAPENTLAAFASALSLRADAIELDVRSTADGRLVVLHDETLWRTAGDPRRIGDMTLREVARLRAAVRPPALSEVLDAFGDRTSYLIEVKRAPGCERTLVDAVRSRGLLENTVVQSFDHLALRRIARHEDRLELAALFEPAMDVASALDLVAPFVGGIGPAAAATDGALVAAAHRRGLAVRPWTVNRAAELRRLAALGVDGVITDVPDGARRVVGDGRRPSPSARGPLRHASRRPRRRSRRPGRRRTHSTDPRSGTPASGR